MTRNGQESPKVAIQIIVTGDACPECGVAFMLTAVGVPIPSALMVPAMGGQVQGIARAVWRFDLCMHCLYRRKMEPDANDKWQMVEDRGGVVGGKRRPQSLKEYALSLWPCKQEMTTGNHGWSEPVLAAKLTVNGKSWPSRCEGCRHLTPLSRIEELPESFHSPETWSEPGIGLIAEGKMGGFVPEITINHEAFMQYVTTLSGKPDGFSGNSNQRRG